MCKCRVSSWHSGIQCLLLTHVSCKGNTHTHAHASEFNSPLMHHGNHWKQTRLPTWRQQNETPYFADQSLAQTAPSLSRHAEHSSTAKTYRCKYDIAPPPNEPTLLMTSYDIISSQSDTSTDMMKWHLGDHHCHTISMLHNAWRHIFSKQTPSSTCLGRAPL